MFFNRIINFKDLNTSIFVFGPRLTGKTTLLKGLKYDAYFDLLDPELELQYKTNPKVFWQQLSAIKKGALIIIDEVQKIPMLLNYVQMAIDQFDHNFILSGSSARKLKRGGANLLGGRAIDLKLHSLALDELGESFSISDSMSYGTLPKIYSLLKEGDIDLAKMHLKSYVSTYLKEEIQAEALTRNIGAFNRFLNIAAQNNAQVIEFQNISRECSVPATTVKEYYQILEDTLLGFFLWPFNKSERKKSRPKFYFFDCGIIRAMQNQLNDPPNSIEKGYLFETWFINELIRIRDYFGKEHKFSFWRNRNKEVDIIISNGVGPILAIECKSGNTIRSTSFNGFKKAFPNVDYIIASLNDDKPRKVENIDVFPWRDVIDLYKEMS